MHKFNFFDFDLQLFGEGDPAGGGDPAPAGGGTPPAADPPADPPADPGNNPPGDPSNNPPADPGKKDKPFNFPPDEDEPVVPEKYEFNLPEGLQITPELESKFTEIAKGAKLTQEQANSLIQMHSDIVLGIQREAEAIKDKWAAECKAQGLSSNENLRAAKLAVDTFGGGAAMTALVESGVAFNPAVQKMLQNIGKLLSEDNAPDGANDGKQTSEADLLFANSKY